MAKHYECKKCDKCFLTPYTCGAKEEHDCLDIYDSKLNMFLYVVKDFAPIVLVILYVILGVICTCVLI